MLLNLACLTQYFFSILFNFRSKIHFFSEHIFFDINTLFLLKIQIFIARGGGNILGGGGSKNLISLATDEKVVK